jgi:hypothetical protein
MWKWKKFFVGVLDKHAPMKVKKNMKRGQYSMGETGNKGSEDERFLYDYFCSNKRALKLLAGPGQSCQF